MTPKSPLDPETLVSDALARAPAAAAVFVRRGMACPGCSMAPFMTLGEAALAYKVSIDELLDELAAALPVDI